MTKPKRQENHSHSKASFTLCERGLCVLGSVEKNVDRTSPATMVAGQGANSFAVIHQPTTAHTFKRIPLSVALVDVDR